MNAPFNLKSVLQCHDIEQSSGIWILSPSAVDTSCNRSVMFVRIDRSFGERRERLRSRIRQLIHLPKRV